ncbi:MAG TPA: DUF6494 family protein [Acidiferrobacterales bacterium]|nr:DUF6494 family protein [Acidiferrobacterales bacterium]
MNEEAFNMEVRKFLKKVGITAQREIEKAVRTGLDTGKLKGNERLQAMVTVKIAELGMSLNIDGQIGLE